MFIAADQEPRTRHPALGAGARGGPGVFATARSLIGPVDSVLVGVQSLAQPGFLIEVDAIAVIDG